MIFPKRAATPLTLLLLVGATALLPTAAQAKKPAGNPGQPGPTGNNSNYAAPSITNVLADVLQPDGTYLWQYTVQGGTAPALGHWVLGLCADDPNTFSLIKDSLVPGSVVGGSYVFMPPSHPDPTTGAVGLKFSDSLQDGQTMIYSFRLNKDWAPALGTATFKAGQILTSQSVLAPGCDLRTHDVVPEPGTVALVASGLLPLAGMVVARRRSKA